MTSNGLNDTRQPHTRHPCPTLHRGLRWSAFARPLRRVQVLRGNRRSLNEEAA